MAFDENLNRYRVFPRIAFVFMLYWASIVILWYIELEDPSVEQSAAFSAFTASSIAFLKFYFETPRRDRGAQATRIDGE